MSAEVKKRDEVARTRIEFRLIVKLVKGLVVGAAKDRVTDRVPYDSLVSGMSSFDGDVRRLVEG